MSKTTSTHLYWQRKMKYPKRKAVVTMQQYAESWLSFTQVQSKKPRYKFEPYEDEDGERYIKATPNKMTNTFQELEKEYKKRNKTRYKKDTIYFII